MYACAAGDIGPNQKKKYPNVTLHNIVWSYHPQCGRIRRGRSRRSPGRRSRSHVFEALLHMYGFSSDTRIGIRVPEASIKRR